MDLEGFSRSSFSHQGVAKTVYRRGQGPAVVLIHELPGMIPQCVDLGTRLADEGFTVFMPLLFGKAGVDHGLAPLGWLCVWREFNLLRGRRSSPVTSWLRALARHAHQEAGGRGVGAIGMCLTGGFALGMMMDDILLAPVLSQPSMPITVPWLSPASQRAALGVSDEEWDHARRRARDEGVPLLGLRFTGDPLCPPERFESLRRAFGERFEAVELPGRKHSVLTLHFKDIPEPRRGEVWAQLVAFLTRQLK